MDLVSLHFYGGVDGQRFGAGPDDASLLVTIKADTDAIGKQLYVGEFGEPSGSWSAAPSAPFTHSFLQYATSLGIPYASPWVMERYWPTFPIADPGDLEPGRTDSILSLLSTTSFLMGGARGVSTETAPDVVVLSPLDGAALADSTIVTIVASDRGQAVAQVSLSIDGRPIPASAITQTCSVAPYSFTVDVAALGLATGPHALTATGVGVAGDRGTFTVPVTAPGTCPAAGARGFLDAATPTTGAGWAYDPALGARAASVQIFVDGELAASVAANQPRPDLVAAKAAPEPDHGFSFTLSGLAVGPHTVRAYAVSASGTSVELKGSGKTVTVAATLAVGAASPPR